MSGIIYLASDSLSCFAISFFSGFLIDLDHLVDYYSHTGFNFRVKHFFVWCRSREFEYLTVFFHSLECLFLLWLAILFFGLGKFWVSLAIGFSQHMFFDLVFNRSFLKTHKFYFLTLRLLKGFRIGDFVQKKI